MNPKKKVSDNILEEIKKALVDINYGSIEIYVSNSEVTQITKRVIKKIEN